MFLDAVIDRSTHEVLFNGSVADTCRFVLEMDPNRDDYVYVAEGASLRIFTPVEYLDRYNLKRK